ncbi:MAG: mitochondrial fission ELM1 family protein [Alphaproteobacteria bacterium]|nr:mitochondrial fission ELM1 family protein [Alphaproteobacteria bacterium]
MVKIWALLDDRMGNNNQILGVAEALGLPFEQKKIVYNKLVHLPNFLRGKTTCGIDESCLREIDLHAERLPDLIIGAGRRMFPLMRYLKKKSRGRTRLVQMMNPGFFGFKEADLVVLPRHDRYKGKAKNVMQTLGSPHRVTKQKLEEELEKWRPVFEKYAQPRISVIVGGSTKKMPFTVEMAKQLALGVLDLNPGSILVTTSRRTPIDVIQTLKQMFPADKTYFYQFGDKEENPYFGLLAWGGRIVVTGDSMSMCSECCATGVPVYIFSPQKNKSKKHALFHQQLYETGYATALGCGQTAFGGRLNSAQDVAERIRSLLPVELPAESD